MTTRTYRHWWNPQLTAWVLFGLMMITLFYFTNRANREDAQRQYDNQLGLRNALVEGCRGGNDRTQLIRDLITSTPAPDTDPHAFDNITDPGLRDLIVKSTRKQADFRVDALKRIDAQFTDCEARFPKPKPPEGP